MPDYTWTVGTHRDDDGIVINGETSGSTPSYTRGERASLDFAFWYDSDIDSTTDGHIHRYEAFREYGDYAGSMSVNRAQNGKPHFTERLPDDAAVDTLVLDFIPGDDVTATDGFWAVVRSMDDQTRFPTDTARVSLNVMILAEIDEYTDLDSIREDRGEAVI